MCVHLIQLYRFLICEVGGTKIHNLNWKPNPWKAEKCGRDNCFPCLGEGGGNCWQPGSTYSLNCDECSENHPKSSQNGNTKKLEVAE